MDEIVSYWIETWTNDDPDERGWSLILTDDLGDEDPNLCFDFIIAVLKKDPPAEVAGQLAASVLEDLLGKHGSAVIDRVETEARGNAKFQDLLGIMYTSSIPGEIRERVDRLVSKKQ